MERYTEKDLIRIREEYGKRLEERRKRKIEPGKKYILTCGGTSCLSIGGEKSTYELFKKVVADKGIEDVEVINVGCMRMCSEGPLVALYPGGVLYTRVKDEDAVRTIVDALEGDSPYIDEDHHYKDPLSGEVIHHMWEIPFFKYQESIILGRVGLIDPTSIEEYIGAGGYFGLLRALKMSPDEVIEEIYGSGLRGRGGAGFPTGLKWKFARQAQGEPKYVIANGDEGDPGAYMNRAEMEGDPFALIEGLTIAGYAIGASKGYIYTRAEYPLAAELVEHAIQVAKEKGLLGQNILGTDFSFDIEVFKGAGAFVCGEETALIASIEGKAGRPRPRPPFPAQKGLWGEPTLINNVETLMNVALIMERGAEWFKGIGTQKSTGTKVFALAGSLNVSGLVEVPLGTPIKVLVEDIARGAPQGHTLKAVQMGGPSGGCVPTEHFDVAIDYESLRSVGAIMGSGGVIALDESSCMVDVAKFFIEFTKNESCGQCTPCRDGLVEMYDILTRITEGKGKREDVEKLEKLATVVKNTSLCGLGQTAPGPVLSTLTYFKDEYMEHVENKRCPAKVCLPLIEYYILPDACRGCTICAKKCPVNAIAGEPGKLHTIDTDVCIKCGTCMAVCPFDAVVKKDAYEERGELYERSQH